MWFRSPAPRGPRTPRSTGGGRRPEDRERGRSTIRPRRGGGVGGGRRVRSDVSAPRRRRPIVPRPAVGVHGGGVDHVRALLAAEGVETRQQNIAATLRFFAAFGGTAFADEKRTSTRVACVNFYFSVGSFYDI